MMNNLRMLRANEIEVRPAHKVGERIAHLLYIDSRAAIKYLNEWVGWNNWQSEFYAVGNQIVGKLGVWDSEKQMWIWKSDVGSESSIEKEKGLISDAYKRLLVRFGVVELYTAPEILIPDDGYGNKGYKVSEISYNEQREIIHLVIVNRFNKEVFRWDSDRAVQSTYPQESKISNHERQPKNETIRYNDNKLSNDEKLKLFCDSIRGIEDETAINGFLAFYLKSDKDNPNISIATRWADKFDPAKRWESWKNKINNNNKNYKYAV